MNNDIDALLQQMQVPQQVLQQMIQENAEVTEAERQGITVSDAEVRAAIMAIPGLQENGHFIGEDRYRQLLRAQDPPMTPADFERNVRQGLMLDKFRAGLTEWMSVADAELEREYRQRNEKVTLDVVAILARIGAHHQVLAHAQERKHLAPLRHVRDAGARHPFRQLCQFFNRKQATNTRADAGNGLGATPAPPRRGAPAHRARRARSCPEAGGGR